MTAETVCWMAYYDDWSGCAVFPTELEALRYAVGSSMQVIECHAGDVREQIERERRAAHDR